MRPKASPIPELKKKLHTCLARLSTERYHCHDTLNRTTKQFVIKTRARQAGKVPVRIEYAAVLGLLTPPLFFFLQPPLPPLLPSDHTHYATLLRERCIHTHTHTYTRPPRPAPPSPHPYPQHILKHYTLPTPECGFFFLLLPSSSSLSTRLPVACSLPVANGLGSC